MSKVLGKGNYIIAKVNGAKQVLTSSELAQMLKDGYDVEVVAPS